MIDWKHETALGQSWHASDLRIDLERRAGHELRLVLFAIWTLGDVLSVANCQKLQVHSRPPHFSQPSVSFARFRMRMVGYKKLQKQVFPKKNGSPRLHSLWIVSCHAIVTVTVEKCWKTANKISGGYNRGQL